jgi:RNA-binding protein 25
MTEIAQFRERSAKREREKMRDVKQGMPVLGAPSGPKMREWGKPQNQPQASPQFGQGMGTGPQGYDKPVGFVKAAENGSSKGPDTRQLAGKSTKTDEELETERKEARKRDEDASFRDVSLLFVTFTDSSRNLLLNKLTDQ